MNIKPLFEIDAPRWFEDAIPVSFVIAVLSVCPAMITGFLMKMSWLQHNEQTLQVVLMLTMLPALMMLMPFLFTRIAAYQKRAHSLVLDRLREQDRMLLVQMSASPEMDETERKLVVEVLNEQHPGWSFDLSTVNTTR